MSNQAAIQFAICNEIFQGWKIEDVFSYASRTGYDAVEIAPFTLADRVALISPAERQRIRQAAERAGIAISGIHWVLVKPEGLYINHVDAAIRQRTAQYFRELVDFCADIGGRFMVVGSPKQRNVLPTATYQQAWDWALETFRVALDRATEREVTLCLEPLSPQETNFLNTAEETIRFIQALNHPRFKMILDVKAMSSESKPIPEIIRDSWPHFAYFHVNDPNLKGPGFGEMDFGPIASALKAAGYHGYASVEVFRFDEGPEVIATRSLEYLKRVFAQAKAVQAP